MSVHLGRYEVRAKIAEGGMATIYLGKLVGEAGFERPVALKVIKDEFCLNREFVNMFLDEAKIVSRLSHSNIVQLIELGKEGHRLFIAMELLMGQSLWSVWDACRERNIRLRYDVVSWIGARVAEGLHHAHELRGGKGEFVNLVHRDVNASNIFITYDGQVKVVDFGLAKAAGRISRTAAGIVKGKLAYMSPEQTVGRSLDRRTDVFALGATLWELTVDRRLFKGKDDVSTLTAVNEARVPDPTKLVAEYPPELWKVLRSALERDKEKRFPTALEMGKALDECSYLEGRRVTAETIAEVMEALFENERRRMAAWVAASVPAESASHSDKPRSSDRRPTVHPGANSNGANSKDTPGSNPKDVIATADTNLKDASPSPNLKEVSATPRANPKGEKTSSSMPPTGLASGPGPDSGSGSGSSRSPGGGIVSPASPASRPQQTLATGAGSGGGSLPRTIAPRRITTSTPPPGAFAPPVNPASLKAGQPRRSKSSFSSPPSAAASSERERERERERKQKTRHSKSASRPPHPSHPSRLSRKSIPGHGVDTRESSASASAEFRDRNSEGSFLSSQVGVGPSTVQRAMGGDASCATFSLKFSYFDLDELAAVLVGLGAVALAIATAAAILWDP